MSTANTRPTGPCSVPNTPQAIHHPVPESEAFEEGPASIFAALGDPTRLELISRLGGGGGRSIVSLTRQAITKHLQVLENAGLVTSRRVGRESRYAVRPETFGYARTYLETVSAQWDTALARLRAHVDR